MLLTSMYNIIILKVICFSLLKIVDASLYMVINLIPHHFIYFLLTHHLKHIKFASNVYRWV